MIDESTKERKNERTKERLTVSQYGDSPPYVMLPVSQIDAVRRLLDGDQISYRVDEQAISYNGGPEISVINLRRGTDARTVQQMLDDAE